MRGTHSRGTFCLFAQVRSLHLQHVPPGQGGPVLRGDPHGGRKPLEPQRGRRTDQERVPAATAHARILAAVVKQRNLPQLLEGTWIEEIPYLRIIALLRSDVSDYSFVDFCHIRKTWKRINEQNMCSSSHLYKLNIA